MTQTKTPKAAFGLTLAALLVSACQPETPPNDDDNGDFYQENGWTMVWSDEFDGTTIDRSKWAFEENCWGGGNNESQCYVDDPDNAFVQDGVLTIRAIREDVSGPVYNPDDARHDPAVISTKPFSSARLRSVAPVPFIDGQDPSFHFRNDWKYGRIEVRAKVPSGQGTWAAAWMLPTDWEFGGWAMSGEIDILEAVNIGAQTDAEGAEPGELEQRVYGTLHYGRAWPGNVYSGTSYNDILPADNFHTYTIEWQQGEIRWFVDDVHYATQTKEGWYTHYIDENGQWQTSGATDAPFNQKFHLILKLAMGGNWAGNVNEGGIDDTITQADFLVDYVRVYQCEDDATGEACATRDDDAALVPGVVEPMVPTAADFTTDPLTLLGDTLRGDWQLATWDGDGGDSHKVVEEADQQVFDLTFSGNGAAYLYGNAGKLSDFTAYAGGEMRFEMRWLEGSANGLVVGLAGPSLGEGQAATGTVDQSLFGAVNATEWTAVTLDMNQVVATQPSLNMAEIDVPFKVTLTGDDVNQSASIRVQIRNLTISKGDYTPPEPPTYGDTLTLLGATVGEGFEAQLYPGWNEPADDTLTITDGVMRGTHSGGGNISLASSTGALDLSEFADGHVQFDLRIIDQGTATDVLIKMSDAWPNLGDVALSETSTSMPTLQQWATYSIPVATFVSNGNRLDGSGVLNLQQVSTPFVVEAFGGGNLDVEVRNVRLTK